MLSIFHPFSKPPSLKHLPLKRYLVDFSLDRLSPGVDNIHIDVHISPQCQNTVKRAVSLLISKHSGLESFFNQPQREALKNELNTLKHVCTEVLLDGISRAKSASEVQIDFLGQVSLVKLFIEEIRNQYEIFIANFKEIIISCELSHGHDPIESFKMKEQLNELNYNQRRILLRTGVDLFRVMTDITSSYLRTIRQSNFRPEHILPDKFFLNPILYTDNIVDELFLTEAYVLFGQRSEDPDHYQKIKLMLYDLLEKTDLSQAGAGSGDSIDEDKKGGEKTEESILHGGGNALDQLMMEVDNIDRMFNYFEAQDKYERFKRNKESKTILDEIKSQMKIQKRLFNLFYRKFKKSRVMKRIVATYEMKAIYGKYCPPLRPHQVQEFLVERSSRKPILRQLRNWKPESLLPLHEMIRQTRKCSVHKKKQYLLCFLKDFSCYHRDLRNYRLLRGLMDTISLIKEEKILMLSRENRSLYEFLRPAEWSKKERPIVNHVIVKADVRGSVDITYTMIDRGLNPASYFSLNFFGPISEILCDHGGSKEFIEGDAIILSIFEHEDTPQGWNGVARACGLAVRMLHIVQQYNVKSQKHNLPILELGIGICYKQGPPSFLFDGDSRIIISPAINLADRLSSCNKMLRKRFNDQNKMFNLYVFQDATEEAFRATTDDLSLRYNVNGIELSPEGFAKLSQEINLKSVMYPVDMNEKVKLYTGTVPILTGGYQRLVIREANILQVKPETMAVICETPIKYYEVCTKPEIFEFIKNNTQT